MSYQQGLQIGNALMGMGTAIGGAIDRQRDNAWQNRVQGRQEQTWQRQDQQYNQENAYNQQLNSYLAALQQDPNYEPERIDATNAKAWWDASYRVTTQRLEEAKTKGYLDDQKISQLKAKNTEGLDLAKKFISAPEGENKKRMGVEWWNKYYDNGQLVEEMPGSDKMRVRSILTGKQREMPSLSAEQIETTMKDYYGKRGLPQKRSMVEAQAINIANKKVLSSPKTYVDEKGMVVYYVDGVIDPKTKEINSYYTLRPPQMDAPLTVDQVAAAGFDFDSARMISGPPSPKDQAEIGLKQAQTQKTQAGTKKIQAETQAIKRGGNVSTSEKKYQGDLNRQNLMAEGSQYGLMEMPLGGSNTTEITGRVSKENIEKVRQLANKYGYNVYGDNNTSEVGGGWFKSGKEVYNIRLAPNVGSGAIQRQGAAIPQQTTVTPRSEASPNVPYQAPQQKMGLRDSSGTKQRKPLDAFLIQR